jgi:hypothetical protein
MELNTKLKPVDLHSIFSRAYELYYEPELTKLRHLNNKIFEWENDISDSIQFEVRNFKSLNDHFDEIILELDTFREFLNSGIIAMMAYNETIKEKKPMHEFYKEMIFNCAQLFLELENFDTNQNLFLQMNLIDNLESDEYDY